MEYRRKCNVCGKIYCYTSNDLSNNNINIISSGLSSISAFASFLGGGTRFDTYALNSQADRYDSKIIKFEQCPSCHSMDTVLLSDEKWSELQKQSGSSGGIAVKAIEINPNATVESLLRRAYLFLEDAEWQTADAYFEKILDVEPENAQAYLGKLLAELQISSISELQTCDKEFEESSNWKKALRFADEKLSEHIANIAKYRMVNGYPTRKTCEEIIQRVCDEDEANHARKVSQNLPEDDARLYRQSVYWDTHISELEMLSEKRTKVKSDLSKPNLAKEQRASLEEQLKEIDEEINKDREI